MTGMRIGKLVVLRQAPKTTKHGGTDWVCRCDCGNEVVKNGRYLRAAEKNGRMVSCGCFVSERAGNIHRTHGLRHTRLARIHRGMCSRCTNPNANNYYKYGGRGIYVCDEWYTPGVKGNPGFLAFYKWAYENGYYDQPKDTPLRELLSIDRIDNDGPYAPWNCRWTTMSGQTFNRRTTQTIYDGEETLLHAHFEDKYKLYRGWCNRRKDHHWSDDAIVFAAKHPEFEMTLTHGEHAYRDKEGFIHLIPVIKKPDSET